MKIAKKNVMTIEQVKTKLLQKFKQDYPQIYTKRFGPDESEDIKFYLSVALDQLEGCMMKHESDIDVEISEAKAEANAAWSDKMTKVLAPLAEFTKGHNYIIAGIEHLNHMLVVNKLMMERLNIDNPHVPKNKAKKFKRKN